MNKTNVPDSPIIGRQYHNRQVTLYFCARRSVGRSVRLGTKTSVGRSVRLSAKRKNAVRFLLVTQKNVNRILGSIKT
jgi:hypothetical protein